MYSEKTCEAIVEFRLNTPDVGEGYLIKPGESFKYDGYKATVTTIEGIEKSVRAPVLKKTEGEWYKVVSSQEQESGSSVKEQQPAPQKSSTLEEIRRDQAASRKRVESSNPGGDGPPQDLNKMVEEYEKKTDKGVNIIDEDSSVVKKISKVEGVEGNSPSVTVEETDLKKRPVVSSEERAVKETNYNNKTVEESQPKKVKREIISDSDGDVVKKTSNPAIYKEKLKETKASSPKKSNIVTQDGDVALNTDYSDEGKSVEVGSSTKAQISETMSSRSKKAKVGVKNVETQDAKVVGKTRKTTGVKETSDGFSVKTTVGSNDDVDVPEATTESNSDVIVGEAKTYKGSESPYEITDSDDLDIGDILENV